MDERCGYSRVSAVTTGDAQISDILLTASFGQSAYGGSYSMTPKTQKIAATDDNQKIPMAKRAEETITGATALHYR